MEQPKVSIVITFYNLGEYIESTLKSCLEQTYINKEIIIVNDNSNDPSSIETYKKIKIKYKNQIIFLDHEKNKGLAAARNTGIRKANGQYICCMDSDDLIHPAYIEMLTRQLINNKDISISTSWIKVFGTENYVYETKKMYPYTALDENTLCGSSVFTKQAWESVNGYDESMTSGYEDWDFWIRLIKHGYKSSIIEDPLFYYRKRGVSLLSKAKEKRYNLIKYLITKHKDLFNKYSDSLYLKQVERNIYLSNSLESANISIRKLEATRDENKEMYKKIKKLEENLKQIQSSLSWKIVMFIRVNILDVIVPKRQIFLVSIIILLKRIKNKIKTILRLLLSPTIYFYNQLGNNYDPLVSIVITCFNYGEYVEDAINSVKFQTFNNYELIVVDGGSNDSNTIKKLKKLQIKNDDLRISFYFRSKRYLVGNNRNYGISKAKGKYICCLDADDSLSPTYLEKAIYYLETQNLDIVSCSIRTFGSESNVYTSESRPDLKSMLAANHIATVAVFRKKLFLKFGGYKDWGLGSQHIPEDYDLWIRYISHGAKALNINEPLMLYRKTSDNCSLSSCKDTPKFEYQKKVIIKNNMSSINNFSLLWSKIQSKIQYRSINGMKSATSSSEVPVLFALPYTVLGGADKIFSELVAYFFKHKIKSAVITTIPFDNMLHDTSEEYMQTTPYLYHLPRFLENQKDWYSFIKYFISTYRVKNIILGGSKYFYDHLNKLKKDFPHIKIIDIQFNTDVHFTNNRNNSKYIDFIVADQKEVYNKYTKEYFVPKNKIKLLSYGVNLDEFSSSLNQILSKPIQIPDNKFIVTYLGRLSPEKNPEFIVDLANEFRNVNNIHFLIGGVGVLYEKLSKRISSENLTNVTLLGRVNSKEYLCYSNCVIVPSIIDGSPIVIKESLSMGVPVIASSVGGIPDLLINKKTGYLCRPNSLNDFYDAIDEISHLDNASMNSLKNNCRTWALQHLDVKKVWSQYKKLIR